ncbi:MAG TPA: 4-hydroxythreonine-4-phosphate dehydrogenase PdxA [Pirellulales bacterium]|nr:4-hydroxythreonine-4-phosphate dehydrogenase PdxA [Pirellulales bacterium]
MPKPLLAITQGDPTGVGPEIIVGAWAQPALHERSRAVVVGHPGIIQRAVDLLGTGAHIVSDSWEVLSKVIKSSPKVIPCLSCGSDEVLHARPATIDPRGGQAAYDALVTAAKLALAGELQGIVTAPLHKAALWRAGHHYPGHTELLAELCGASDFAMMLYLPWPPAHGLGVVHVTLHMALADVFRNLSTEAILTKALLLDRTMTALIGRQPRIGVCALNPHAGEEGLFGDEELRLIAPAVEQAKRARLTIDGPFPADTLMTRARDGQFDGVVAMYHDQGHIAIKLLGMHRAVNITLGLPIVRTSVAHGTAFDLAWQGRAETHGLVEAVRVAASLAQGRGADTGFHSEHQTGLHDLNRSR